MPLIDGPDCALWVESRGRGEPVSVFAHGITGSTFDLEPLAARTPGTRVLFDQRGHGRSAVPGELGTAAMAQDLDFVAARYGAARAFGLSAGAGAILSLLEKDPDRFERVVLMLPASIDRAERAGAYPALATLLEQHALDDVVGLTIDAPEYQPLFAVRPAWRAVVAERIRRMNATGVPRAIRAHVDGPPPVSDVARLREVRARALVIAHRDDPVHDIAVAERLVDVLPKAELLVWDEPLGMYDDTDALADLIGSFISA
ncbi:MAG: alpha/beta fold hydrolase [Actinomycetota bacterium]